MSLKNHYGVTIDTDKPITGVIQTNNCPGLIEDSMYGNYIDIDFEEHCKHCDNEYHDDCYYNDEPTLLIGFYLDESTRLYEIDNGCEYSAIVQFPYTQIVHSKYVSNCALCSPCYPGQGDLDTEGEYKTYSLNPDMFYDGSNQPVKAELYNEVD